MLDKNLKSKSGGWSAHGILTRLNPIRQVGLQAEFPYAGDYTIQFTRDAVPAGISVRTEALITWSVEGNFVFRRVNVVNGVSVTGTGQAVKVVINDTTVDPMAFAPGPDYTVSMQVAPGTRPAVQQPPQLIPATGPIFAFGPGTVNIPVPDDAGVISVFGTVVSFSNTPIPSEQAFIQMSDAALNTLKVYDPRQYDWVPLAPGTTFITLINATAADTLQFSVTFGIDG
jgi:hypothetical protein